MLNKDWSFIWRNLRRGNYHPYLNKVYRAGFRFKQPDGVRVMEEDWDVLIILDACRADIFKEYNTIEGELQTRISRGSATPEWLRRNFTDFYDDTVYVTANPFISPADSGNGFDSSNHFPEVIPVYKDDATQEKGTTLPEAVTDAALTARDRWPEKRMIVHYNQPHAPFIGEPELTWEGMDRHDQYPLFTDPRIQDAYMSNLQRALPAVEELVGRLDGRIVVSADHGEMFGENGVLAHPPGIYFRELIEVPWLVIDKGKRPTIRPFETSGLDI